MISHKDSGDERGRPKEGRGKEGRGKREEGRGTKGGAYDGELTRTPYPSVRLQSSGAKGPEAGWRPDLLFFFRTPPASRTMLPSSLFPLPAFRFPLPPLLERAQPRDRLAEYQRVDVVGALVGIDALQILHMAHRCVLGEDAVGAQKPPRLAGDVGGDTDVVALGKRDLLWSEGARVLHATEVEREKLTFDQLGQHVSEPPLLELEPGDWFSKHHSVAGVSECFLVTRLRRTHCTPGNPVPRLRKTHQGTFDSAGLGEKCI